MTSPGGSAGTSGRRREPRCERCDLPLSMCEHAPKNLAKAEAEAQAKFERERELALRGAMRSRFNTECPQCGGRIETGDFILPSDTTWVHAEPAECDGTTR